MIYKHASHIPPPFPTIKLPHQFPQATPILFPSFCQQYYAIPLNQQIFSLPSINFHTHFFCISIVYLHQSMNQRTIFVLVSLLIVFGAINTIQLKLQNIHVLDRETGEKFFHPFTQTILLFIGQACVGFFYLYHRKKGSNKNDAHRERQGLLQGEETPKKPIAPAMKAFWPAVFDLLATLFSYLALNTVDSSVWQMSKGGVIVTTAILSRIFLKRIFTKRAILGCSLAFVGITSVQIVAVLSTSSQSNVTTTGELIGLGLLFISILFNSFGLIIEKKIFDQYEIHPLKMVFLQGEIGVVLMSLLTYGFQFIPCPWINKHQCVCLSEDACYLQNYSKYFFDLGRSNMLIFLTCGFICSIAISVPIGAYLSKEVSPISRSLANVSRTLFIWIFNIIMTTTLGQTMTEYRLESASVVVNLMKGLGFATLMFGTFLYHEKKKVEATQEKNEANEPVIVAEVSLEIKDQEIIDYLSTKSKSEADTNLDSEQNREQEIYMKERLIIN